MTVEERLVADYAGTGLTVGKHPMHYRRAELRSQGILSSEDLRRCRDGVFVRAAGCVIARQRPGTAKGFIFISMEDETGIANVIVTPDVYEQNRLVVTRSKFLLVEGALQNQDGVIHVKATRLAPLAHGGPECGPTTSTDAVFSRARTLAPVSRPAVRGDLQTEQGRQGPLCARFAPTPRNTA